MPTPLASVTPSSPCTPPHPQYFTDDEAQAAVGGLASHTGGHSHAMDFAPVFVGYQNCQDLDVAELQATANVLEKGGA